MAGVGVPEAAAAPSGGPFSWLARPMDHRRRQRQLLLHSVREIRHKFPMFTGQLHELKQFFRSLIACRCIQAVHAPHKLQILGCGQPSQ